MLQDIAALFSRMGLKDRDVRVFLVCVAVPEEGLFTHEIVRQTKIKRSTVDLIIRRLLDQAFISRVRVGARYKYFAEPLESILFRQEQVADDLRTLIPAIKKLGGSGGETQIRFFEGIGGVRKMYDSVLLALKFAEGSQRELLSFSSGTHAMKIFPDQQRAFIDKRIRMGIPIRIVAPDVSAGVQGWDDDPKALRYVRYIDHKVFPFKVSFEVFADCILLTSTSKPVGGILIRNPRIADSLRSLFEFVWGCLAASQKT